MSLDLVRAVADAVLFEGYLLYPYRATSRKNQVRWQFGVLGPPTAAAAGLGEDSSLAAQCLVRTREQGAGPPRVTVHLRFLQLQTRSVERATGAPARFEPVDQLTVGSQSWLSWDEAVEQEVELDASPLSAAVEQESPRLVEVPGRTDIETLRHDDGTIAGRLVRRRWPLRATVGLEVQQATGGLVRIGVRVDNVADGPVADKDDAIRSSLIGAHLLLRAEDADFVSLLEPPPDAADAAAGCTQHRCWPVLAGAPGSCDVVLVSPIILYDYPEVADQSAGALFDSTEIDEILTLRIMTLTDDEKAQARATDPRAAEIIDRCDAMPPEALARLHGILRDPRADLTDPAPRAPGSPDPLDQPDPLDPSAPVRPDIRELEPPVFSTADVPWWDPEADASVQPDVDTVLVDGVRVARDSLVRLHPSRRADAQDLFFAGQTARVTAVHSDVDGNVHVAVVLVDDPAADLHDWYGRYLYFAPDELEPLVPPDGASADPDSREGSRL
jgi:hypothetical protein